MGAVPAPNGRSADTLCALRCACTVRAGSGLHSLTYHWIRDYREADSC